MGARRALGAVFWLRMREKQPCPPGSRSPFTFLTRRPAPSCVPPAGDEPATQAGAPTRIGPDLLVHRSTYNHGATPAGLHLFLKSDS